MKNVISLSREKLVGLVLTVSAIMVGSWAIYYFGPRPEKTIASQAPANQPIIAPTPKREIAPQTLGADLFSEIFKAATTQLASGRTGDPPAKYSESLETIYRRRGYRKLELETGSDNDQSFEKMHRERLKQLQGKVYWQSEVGGTSTISAWGEGADPNTEMPGAKSANVQKQMYMTVVSPAEGGGSQWTTYRYLTDRAKMQAFSDQLQASGDWPGQD